MSCWQGFSGGWTFIRVGDPLTQRHRASRVQRSPFRLAARDDSGSTASNGLWLGAGFRLHPTVSAWAQVERVGPSEITHFP